MLPRLPPAESPAFIKKNSVDLNSGLLFIQRLSLLTLYFGKGQGKKSENQ